jgi:hypothetical protein
MKYLIIFALLLSACGKSGESSQSTAPTCGTKALASTWTRDSDALRFNMSGLKLNEYNSGIWRDSLGKTCNFKIKFTGSECAGAISIIESAGEAAGCSETNGEGTYSKDSTSTLTTCVDLPCKTWR